MMAPHLLLSESYHVLLRRGDESQHKPAKREDVIMVSPWVVVAVIVSVLVVLSLVIFGILYLLRRRRTAKEDGRQLPVIGHHRSVARRRSKMNVADRLQAEEMERSMMIRKSLASRSTFSSTGSRDSQILHSARSSGILNDGLSDTASVVEGNAPINDWKEWEARAQAERRYSRLEELAMAGRAHPALVQELQDLPIPKQARAPSPSRV